MEDHEIKNTREWDLYHKDKPELAKSGGGWKVVAPAGRHIPPTASPSKAKVHEPVRKRDPPNNLPSNLPRQWQVAGPVRRGHNVRREPPKLLQESDNDAEASWRARQEPTDHVRIPDEMLLKARSSDAAEDYHERVAQRLGTYIFSQHKDGYGGSRTFGIWGERKAVEATKRAIADWIEESRQNHKSARSAKFAKVVSLTEELRKRAEKRWDREVAKQRYRQHPPPDMAFGAIGSFHWPVMDYQPDSILGSSAEALDPIRMQLSCYIVYNKERNLFRIMGKPSDVQIGLLRIRQTCFQVAAKQCNPVRMCLLRWPNAAEVPLYVYLKDYEPPAISMPEDQESQKTRKAPRGEEYEPDEQREEQAGLQNSVSSERLRSAVFRTLNKLHYYRGHIQIRIRLGIFLVDQYKAPDERYGVYDLEEYEDMIKESQFSGEVTQELGDRSTEDALLEVVQTASDLLSPSDAMTTDLKDVRPIYTAIFTFEDPGGHYRLSVEWHQTQDAYVGNGSINLDEASKKWTRLDRDMSTPASLLDVSLCDLNKSSAWQFDILASHQVVDETKLPTPLVNFARNLKIDRNAALKSDNSDLFVRFNSYTSLVSIQQRISYQYFIANSDFTLELSRFQDRTYPPRAISPFTTTSANQPIVYEPRWGLNVFREHWDTMLAKNERLGIGEHADWEGDVATWFPVDVGPGSAKVDEENANQGWHQLMEKLGRIERLVASAKAEGEEEDLVGGMTVG